MEETRRQERRATLVRDENGEVDSEMEEKYMKQKQRYEYLLSVLNVSNEESFDRTFEKGNIPVYDEDVFRAGGTFIESSMDPDDESVLYDEMPNSIISPASISDSTDML